MSSITLGKSKHANLDCIKVGSRVAAFDPSICEITKVSAGRWEGKTRNGWSFSIIGGKAAGGYSNEWYVEAPEIWNGSIRVKSAMAAVKLIENT
ncbi:hypothetical protein FDH38_gp102 [Dinoroseobacter phage vB_DshS-R5C]|uniref:Uncharacterized protein n=1 Tax=Dinoroseobacter phage vB_DshS-R5C TaxID=1965368 RepID=A0A1V0DYB2_9CAUD|nr:hypothetical protein FDH38_gp102 [Dinoroseobacter phage vB_DshS-R5C]ARB06156.1 hypothetical protein vBDshSR5C_102 [Dinoroseobacter phage vB_DshS-R5C]